MIVATAGHVDHGKSTLVRLLTGIDPDRWAEEQQRGLTIDLGFAWMSGDASAEGPRLAFVDVPGHRRFLPNMLAGCGAVDMALLVVSAREGWRPQTEEHCQILDLLGVEDGVVAITHCEVVDAARLRAVHQEVSLRLKGTSLDSAAIVATSSDDPNTIDVLRAALLRAAERCSRPTEADRGRPRLWIDRSFTVKGTGRVVTGTLTGGAIALGDELVVSSAGIESAVRVRGVHADGVAVERAPPGSRVGLAVVARGQELIARRGDAVVREGHWTAGHRWQVALFGVRGSAIPTPRGGYRVFIGTASSPTQLRYRHGAPAAPSPDQGSRTPVLARLHLDDRIGAITIGDRFVLRDDGSEETVGGGVLLAVDDDPRRYGDDDLIERWRALGESYDGGAGRLAAALVHQAGGSMAVSSARRLLGPRCVQLAVERSSAQRIVDDQLVDADALASRAQVVLAEVAQVGPRPAPDDPLGRLAVDQLLADGSLERRGSTIQLPGTAVEDRAAAVCAIRDAIDAADPPFLSREELVLDVGAAAGHINAALAAGAIVPTGELVTTGEQFQRLVGQVRATLAEGPADLSTFRDRLGLSRKYLIPLLEAMDAAGWTERIGAQRVWVGGSRGAGPRMPTCRHGVQ